MPHHRPFSELARDPAAALGDLALAIAAEFRAVDLPRAHARLDALGSEVAREAAGAGSGPHAELEVLARVLGERHGFRGGTELRPADHPEQSMLDLVLERRRGLPILLAAVYVEAARRAGIAVSGVGLGGHFVVGHFGVAPPALVDPYAGGAPVPPALVPVRARPWGVHETAMRMLNNLVASYTARVDLGHAIHAAELRLALPADAELAVILRRELLGLRARLN